MISLKEILLDYSSLPEYSGLDLSDVNQKSLFGDRPINISASRGIVEEIEVILSSGGDINSKGEHGYSPLHNAVEQGHLLAVNVLLSHGADALLKSNEQLTPLDLALSLQMSDVAECLRAHLEHQNRE